MIYLLDTNTCIAYLRGRSARVAQALREAQPEDIALCAVVVAELFEGAHRSVQREHNLARVAEFVTRFIILPFDIAAAEIAGQLGADLAARGTPIGAHDLQIAAIALANDLTLVTHNTREFSRLTGLQLEDWERDDSGPTP
jgi:tRNA(fMet)-specific endonuclease VapC